MPISPTEAIPLPFDFNDIAIVRALVLRIAGGAAPAEFAASAEMPVEEFEAALWWTIHRLLGLTLETIDSTPEGGVLVVSGEGLSSVEVEGLDAQFRAALPEGTSLIVSNFPVGMQVIGPLTDGQVLLVTGEECDAVALDELRDWVNQCFPGQSAILANYSIDVETMEHSQVKALQEYCADILTLPPGEVLTGMMPEPENVLTDFRKLADRYVDALMRGAWALQPRPDVEIEVASVGDTWRLRFVEKTGGADNLLLEWEEDTIEKLTMWATATVVALEAMPTA